MISHQLAPVIKSPFAGLAFVFCLVVAGCFEPGKQQEDDLFKATEVSASQPPATTRFVRLSPAQTGIQFTPEIKDEHRYNFIADPYIYNGGGVGIIDVNNDGLQDLFFTARLQGCQLYLNKGNLRFENISESAGVARFSGLKTGVTVVDINADGWMDLYVCRTWLEPLPERRNLLFVNNKNNTFSEVAAAYGLDDLSASQHANFFDYDADGDLDCYILNHPVDFKNMNNLDVADANARRQGPRNEWESDRLLQNNHGRFVDISRQSGVLNRAFGLSTLAFDINQDGWSDLFVGNDFVMPDFLYINQKNGAFNDQAERYFRHCSNHTMGADFGDLNLDGQPDLISLDMLAEPLTRRLKLMNTMQRTRDAEMQAKGYGRQVMRNAVHVSNGLGAYSEVGCLSGMYATDWSWAPLIADYDNDGWQDVFISNGIQRDLNDLDFFVFTADSINRSGGVSKQRFPDFNQFVGLMPQEPVHNYIFRNLGDMQFQDVSATWGFTQKGFSNGAAYADLDLDGDLDLITNQLQAPPAIYENQCQLHENRHWLQVKLKGRPENPFGVGAKLKVWGTGTSGEETLLYANEMTNVRGFYSSVEPIFQIGLGAKNIAERVEVYWPGGAMQRLLNVGANQRLTLSIDDAISGQNIPKQTNAVFRETAALRGLAYTHRENQFEDFDREKLLPYRFSQRGPAGISADLNNDQLDDVYIGGAAGQAGAVFLQQADGSFILSKQPALERDAACEDVGCAVLDVNADGYLDLYVVSGGNEALAGSANYQDRLYLNDGRGIFQQANDRMPVENAAGSCVCVADFNFDGAADLLVGGGCKPGFFPQAETSMLLINQGGRFSDQSAAILPFLKEIGIAGAVLAANLIGDEKIEIVVAEEWGPLRIFGWDGRHWTDQSDALGMGDTHGCWRSLQVIDMDNDGDLDLVAGNIGLNTRFMARPGAPLRLFAADFDKNGSLDPVIVQASGGRYHPVVQREIMASQVPSIKKQFSRNAVYAQSPIELIFDEQMLRKGICLKATTLASQWFENQGSKFVGYPLPYPAQIAPVEKIVLTDFNRDGIDDLLVLGNDAGMEVETYALNSSVGYLLLNDGKGGFRHLPIGASGQVRDAMEVKSGGRRYWIVLNNNAPIQIFNLEGSTN